MRADLLSAMMLMTRLPLRGTPSAPADGAWAWPVAGLVVGLAGALAAWGAAEAGLALGLAAVIGVAVPMVLTGALHEDGLADCADGMWGGREPVRRLEIMRDSRLGAYGAAALVLALLARWSLVGAALEQDVLWALPAAAAASRAPMAWAMRLTRPAREDGLARHVGTPSAGVAWGGVAVAAMALLPFGLLGVAAALAVAATAWGSAQLAAAKLGGHTGDTLGATQVLCEVAALALLTAT